MKRSTSFIYNPFLYMFLSAILVFILGFNIYRWVSVGRGHETVYDVIVTDKGIKRINDSDLYLVYTQDVLGEPHVFQVTDNLLARRFDSSDMYAKIQVGKVYSFTTRGQRVPLFSWYPNIYDCVEILPP